MRLMKVRGLAISVYIIRMLLLRHDPLMWSSFGPNDLIEENPWATVVGEIIRKNMRHRGRMGIITRTGVRKLWIQTGRNDELWDQGNFHSEQQLRAIRAVRKTIKPHVGVKDITYQLKSVHHVSQGRESSLSQRSKAQNTMLLSNFFFNFNAQLWHFSRVQYTRR